MEDIDKILGFKFTLDLSDFEKAPDIIANALKEIADDAKAEGKNADIEMANYVKRMIEERENVISQLSQAMGKAKADLDKARREFASNANEETEKAFDVATQNVETLSDAMQRAKNELYELQSAENELAGNRSLITKIKLTAQNMDLYGNTMKLLPQPIANVVKAIGPLDAALKKLLANPIVLVIAAVVLAIKALADVAKGVYQYFDFMSERFDSFAYILGTVEGAVRKVVESFKALISADWESLEYNLKTMFDGGDREIERRHRKVEQAERDHQITLNNIENHWLRRRINNTALSYDERLKADKKFMENQVENFKLGKKKIEDEYKDWLDSVAMYDARLNPTGTKKDISLLSLDELEQYKKWQAAFAEADFQIENARAESLDRQAKIREQQFNEGMAELQKRVEIWQKEKQFQRQVREQMESENRRLKQLAQQTENSVLQSQINDMAEGIEKASKQAELKAKQSLEQLNNALYDEARKLYENEKAIFEGNPANEGKMFKAFDYSKYESRARKNIGYGIRESLISHEEMESIRKAVEKITQKALDDAKKVADKVKEIEDRIEKLANENIPKPFSGKLTSGLAEYREGIREYENLQNRASIVNEKLVSLTKERYALEMKLNNAESNEERVKVSEEIAENTEKTNSALKESEVLQLRMESTAKKISNAYAKFQQNATAILGTMSEIAEEFKGISDAGDDMVDAIQQMLSFVGKLASGDIPGAVMQVVATIGKGIANIVKEIRSEGEMSDEMFEKMQKLVDGTHALAQAAEDYKLGLIGAKDAQDALYDTTNIKAMIDAQNKLLDAQKAYDEYTSKLGGYANEGRRQRREGRGMGAFVSSINSVQVDVTAGRNEINRQYKSLETYIKEKFGNSLFVVGSDGNYTMNTDIWDAVKKNNDALAYFTETQVQELDNIAEYQKKIAEAQEEFVEGVTDWYSPLLDDMTDAWMNWLNTGENVMDSFKDYSSDTFRSILQDMLKSQIYEKVFSGYKDKISELTSQYVNEKLNIESYASQIKSATEDVTKQLKDDRFQKIVETWRDQLKDIGIDITGETAGRTAEARGIARASQESVDENNARLAMMQQHTYSINANVMQLTNTSAQMLLQLQGIRSNTDELRRLEHIEKSLANIETYGVTTK